MNIKIVRRPVGEAPEWVRDAWIGLSLPLASRREREWRGVGVLTGPQRWLSQVWALLSGKTFKVTGYAVGAKAAVDQLAHHDPIAAAWWREHTPQMLTGRRYSPLMLLHASKSLEDGRQLYRSYQPKAARLLITNSGCS